MRFSLPRPPIRDIHIQLLTAVRQPVAHGLEVLNAFNALDAVLEDDVVVIIGKDVRPVRLTFGVIGLAPEVTDAIGCQFLGHTRSRFLLVRFFHR